MMMFGGMGITTVSLLANKHASSTDNLQGTQAFYIAEGGMHHLLMNELFWDMDFTDNVSPTDPPFGTNSGSLNPGEFWVEYFNQAPKSLDVKLTARVGDTVRAITQKVAREYQYVALAGGNFSAQGASGIFNGHMGVQGNLDIDSAISVNGGTMKAANLNIPAMDLLVYKSMTIETHTGTKVFTADSTYEGNLYVKGDVNLLKGVTYNGLLYIGGNLNIVGNDVTINGTLVVEGNIITVKDNLKFIAQPIDANLHMPAIVCNGTMDFKNTTNPYIYGLVWSNGVVDFFNSLNLNLEGSLIGKQNLLLNGATVMSLTFKKKLITGVPGLLNLDQTVATLNLTNWRIN